MADTETVIAEPIGAEPEPLASFDTTQLDAILNKIRPLPVMEPSIPTKLDPPVATPVSEPTPVKAEAGVPDVPVSEPVVPAVAPEPAKPAGPFDPPPSVLSELPAKPDVPATIEEEFGVMPEKPARGFKSKEEEANWGNMRASHEKALAEVARLRGEIKAKPPVDEGLAAQLADLTTRNAELNAIVERTAVESHPFVRQNFDEPRRQLFAIAQNALQKIDIDPAQIGRILALNGKARVDAMDELYGQIDSPTTRDKVTNAIAQIDMLEEKRAEFLADRQGNVERMTQAEKAERFRQISAQQENVKGMLSEVVDEITHKFKFPVLKEATEPGSEQWNERVKQDKAWLEFMALENTDPKEQLKCNALARQAPYLLQAWQTSRARETELEKKVAELEGTLPGLNGASATEKSSATGTLAKSDDEMTAAGILPTDSLAVQSRKLGTYWETHGR